MDLVFSAGTSNGAMQCIDMAIVDSPTVEDDETFTVTLSTSDVLLRNDVTVITIMDTDGEVPMPSKFWSSFPKGCYLNYHFTRNHFPVPVVSVPSVLSVGDYEKTVQVCATLSLSTEVNIIVTLATNYGTGVCMYNS